MNKPLALIIGVGDGLSASLARLFYDQGYRIALAARDTVKIDALAKETQATLHRCDASEPARLRRGRQPGLQYLLGSLGQVLLVFKESFDLQNDILHLGAKAIPAIIEQSYKLPADSVEFNEISKALGDLGEKDRELTIKSIDYNFYCHVTGPECMVMAQMCGEMVQ